MSNKQTPNEQIELLIQMQRERRSIIFYEAAIGELVEALGMDGAKDVVNTYSEYLEEFTDV